jgi:hypothetical protein
MTRKSVAEKKERENQKEGTKGKPRSSQLESSHSLYLLSFRVRGLDKLQWEQYLVRNATAKITMLAAKQSSLYFGRVG